MRMKLKLITLFVWIPMLYAGLSCLSLADPGSESAESVADNGDVAPAENPTYRFTLTKGKGKPVCNAYLWRLNTTQFERPPYCGRPENDSITGFALLKRTMLSAEEISGLSTRIRSYTLGKNQYRTELNNDWRVSHNLSPTVPFLPIEGLEKAIGHSLNVWRYDPPIDIDNDGTPDNVLIWQGIGAGSQSGICGAMVAFGTDKDSYPLNQSQLAYVLALDNKRIDEAATQTIFGHPSGGYLVSDGHGGHVMADDFRPIGDSLGIFEFEGLYYMDTFFDNWGDFSGNRKESPLISVTLGVFLRKNSKTQQVCEYTYLQKSATSKEGTFQ